MEQFKILIVGHSHIACLMEAARERERQEDNPCFAFLSLRDEKYRRGAEPPKAPSSVRVDLLRADFHRLSRHVDAVVFCLNGNEHNNFGLFEAPSPSFAEIESRVRTLVADRSRAWLRLFLDDVKARSLILLPPPPVESETHILGAKMAARLGRSQKVRSAEQRHQLWDVQCEAIRETAKMFGVEVFSPPDDIYSPPGFLAPDCLRPEDVTHGNTVYGKRVLERLTTYLLNSAGYDSVNKPDRSLREHPYLGLPDYCYWNRSVSDLDPGAVDPVTHPRFKIGKGDKVATAGSCFAQHISKRLRENGFNFLVVEQPVESEGKGGGRGAYDFSARYGNIYTSRQLLQLFDRAFGYFTPLDRVWPRQGGGFCDPFRPRIEPEGFSSEASAIKESRRHLIAVRRMFKQLDVFVFTLGLTECWVSRLDGAAYPLAPGVAGGEYDPQKHDLVNLRVSDVVNDLKTFVAKLALVNPKARIILTVSPVPLMATAEDRHVLVSNTYSKSVLRVAAEETAEGHDNVCYFPSYEIITGQHIGNAYYAPDRRSVSEHGVDQVMAIFMSRLTEQRATGETKEDIREDRLIADIESWAEVECDEEMLRHSGRAHQSPDDLDHQH